MQHVIRDFKIRAVSEDQRVIEGTASAPTADRTGDVVESLGAEYALPIPFMLDHDHRQVVGEVETVNVSAAGIQFKARIKKIDEPGAAKDLVDMAWSYVKNGLRKFVSIGFRPLEYSYLDGGAVHYTAWEWLELSAVAVPAHPAASISSAKGAAHDHRSNVSGRAGIHAPAARRLQMGAKMRSEIRVALKSMPLGTAIKCCEPGELGWLMTNHPQSATYAPRRVRL